MRNNSIDFDPNGQILWALKVAEEARQKIVIMVRSWEHILTLLSSSDSITMFPHLYRRENYQYVVQHGFSLALVTPDCQSFIPGSSPGLLP